MAENQKKWWVCVWLMFGLVLSLSLAFLWYGNGKIKQSAFWSNGEIYNFSSAELRSGTMTCPYVYEDGAFHVDTGDGSLLLQVQSDVSKWRELILEIKKFNTKKMWWKFSFFDESGEWIDDSTSIMVEGENHIPLRINKKISQIQITIFGQSGTTFRIAQAKLCQMKYDFEMRRLLWRTMWLFCAYLAISAIIFLLRHWDWYVTIEVIQYGYRLVGDRGGQFFTQRLSQGVRDRLRSGLFAIIYLMMIPLNVWYWNGNERMTRYFVLGIAFLMVLIALFSWEKPLKALTWRNLTGKLWLFYCVLLMISDLLVSKEIPYAGFIMLVILGFVFFVWQNAEMYDVFLHNAIRGLVYTLPILVLYCTFFREKKAGFLYNGCFSDRESMALYMMAVCIALFEEINRMMEKENGKRSRMFLNGLGIFFCIYYIYCARSFLCFLVLGIIFMIWIWPKRKEKDQIRKYGIVLVVLLPVAAIMIGAVRYMDHFVPSALGTDIVYLNEKYEMMSGGTITGHVIADISIQIENIGYMITDKITIWANYIRKLNLFGHHSPLFVFKTRTGAYNAVLEIAYTYGIFCIIPYLLFLVHGSGKLVKERKFLAMAGVIAFWVFCMISNLEKMFLQPIWLIFYLQLGCCFNDKGAKDARAFE